jgi:hypothetical protein
MEVVRVRRRRRKRGVCGCARDQLELGLMVH